MGCTARYENRKGVKGLAYVTTMAQHQADIEGQNMQVVEKTMGGVGTYYDYEYLQPEKKRASNFVAVVKVRRGKRKSILRRAGEQPVKKSITKKPKQESSGKQD